MGLISRRLSRNRDRRDPKDSDRSRSPWPVQPMIACPKRHTTIMRCNHQTQPKHETSLSRFLDEILLAQRAGDRGTAATPFSTTQRRRRRTHGPSICCNAGENHAFAYRLRRWRWPQEIAGPSYRPTTHLQHSAAWCRTPTRESFRSVGLRASEPRQTSDECGLAHDIRHADLLNRMSEPFLRAGTIRCT